MAQLKQIEVVAAMNADNAYKTNLEIKELDIIERILQSGKVLALWWGGAVVCIFIPVLHFFLVPGAVLIGIALAYRQFTLRSQVLGGVVECPACHAKVALNSAPFNWPKIIECSACQARILFREC